MPAWEVGCQLNLKSNGVYAVLSILKTPSAAPGSEPNRYELCCRLKSRQFSVQVSRTLQSMHLTLDGVDRTVVKVLLGSAPFVSVMQTTDFGNRNNLADRLYRTRIRRIFIQGEMKAASVVVTDI